jgi:hypothetical protein
MALSVWQTIRVWFRHTALSRLRPFAGRLFSGPFASDSAGRRKAKSWAQRLLVWGWVGPLLTAEVSRARYFIRADRHEVLAWAELRDLDGRRRVEIGSFPSVALARAACERDAQLRCRRDREERGPCRSRSTNGSDAAYDTPNWGTRTTLQTGKLPRAGDGKKGASARGHDGAPRGRRQPTGPDNRC